MGWLVGTVRKVYGGGELVRIERLEPGPVARCGWFLPDDLPPEVFRELKGMDGELDGSLGNTLIGMCRSWLSRGAAARRV